MREDDELTGRVPEEDAKRFEERIRRDALFQARLDEHEQHLKAVNGSIDKTGRAVEGLTAAFAADRAVAMATAGLVEDRAKELKTAVDGITPLIPVVAALHQGFEKIEEREEQRTKEAHDDRKALKTALYSFITALCASALGGSIYVIFG